VQPRRASRHLSGNAGSGGRPRRHRARRPGCPAPEAALPARGLHPLAGARGLRAGMPAGDRECRRRLPRPREHPERVVLRQ